MLQVGSKLQLADNSGVKELQILSVPGSGKKYVTVGDVISASAKAVIPASDLKKGQIVRAVVVRTKKEKRRQTGEYIRFDDNAAVVIDKHGNPIGTRVIGPIAREVKKKGFGKVASLAKELW